MSRASQLLWLRATQLGIGKDLRTMNEHSSEDGGLG